MEVVQNLKENLDHLEIRRNKLIKTLDIMDFGSALEFLKAGKKVARKGWNGKGIFLMLNGGYKLPKKYVTPKGVLTPEFLEAQGAKELVIKPHIDIWTAQKELSVGWRPTNPDMFASDWHQVD